MQKGAICADAMILLTRDATISHGTPCVIATRSSPDANARATQTSRIYARANWLQMDSRAAGLRQALVLAFHGSPANERGIADTVIRLYDCELRRPRLGRDGFSIGPAAGGEFARSPYHGSVSLLLNEKRELA